MIICSSATVTSLLILALFLIDFALTPNLSVDKVSCSLKTEGEHVTIKVVLAFPPKDSYKILVNLESLYLICLDLPSVNELITFPNEDKDWLIFLASSSVEPVAPVFEIFSLPAKSTKNNFPFFTD